MLRKLARNAGRAVIVEFAIVLPVLLTMFVGGYVVTDMIACNRKVTIATRAMTDIITRSVSPSIVTGTTDESTTLASSALVLTPENMAYATETITLLRVCSTTQAYVVWTQTVTQDGSGTVLTSPITQGSQAVPVLVTLPSNILVPQPSTTYYPMVPSPASPSPPTTNINICANTTSSGNTPLVGSTGSYLFVGTIAYSYHPLLTLPGLFGGNTTPMGDTIYMSPRLD